MIGRKAKQAFGESTHLLIEAPSLSHASLSNLAVQLFVW